MKDERWLGYDDDYRSTEPTRQMYLTTWDSLYWQANSMLSLSSNNIVLRPVQSLPGELQAVQLIIAIAIKKART